MNDIQIFNNPKFGQIRTVSKDGEPWFVGKDVAAALGYAKERNAIATHVDSDDRRDAPIQGTLGGNQKMTIINESGLYSLIMGSKLESAKQFKKWVTSEVLPTIRKTGGYVNNTAQFVDTYFPQLDGAQKQTISMMLDETKRLGELIEKQKPKVLFAEAVSSSPDTITIGELAKFLKQNGVKTGRDRLFQTLRDEGFLMKAGADRNIPTQRSMERGLFEIKETVIHDSAGNPLTRRTAKVTGKGQQYFLKRFLER